MLVLKQSTAVTPKLGPFVDSTDGVTAETALTIARADVKLSKAGGSFTQKTETTSATHDANGWYGVPLDTTDTGTLGSLQISIQVSGAAPFFCYAVVVPANIWDSMFGSDILDVSVTQINGSAVSTSTAQLGVNAVQAGGTAWGSGAITAASIATDAITAAKVASDVTTEITSGLATASAVAAISTLIGTPSASVSADIAAVLAAVQATDTTYKKHAAVTSFAFYMELTDGTPGTGLTVAGAISKDGGAFSATATADATEISAGWYKINLTQTEMNADEIALKFTATGAKQRNIKIRTQS